MGFHYREVRQSGVGGGHGVPFGARRCLPWEHLLFQGNAKSHSRTTGDPSSPTRGFPFLTSYLHRGGRKEWGEV